MHKIKTFAITAGALLATSGAVFAQELTVSAWGGFFEETLAAEIYPGFTEETGITVKSIAQPEDSAWMTQLMAAARAKKAPADLSLVVDEVLIRGNEAGLWGKLDPAKMAGTQALKDGYVKLDASWDEALVNTGNFARWVVSPTTEDPHASLNLTARQTRLGFRAGSTTGSAQLSGVWEADFYAGAAENKNGLQVRQA